MSEEDGAKLPNSTMSRRNGAHGNGAASAPEAQLTVMSWRCLSSVSLHHVLHNDRAPARNAGHGRKIDLQTRNDSSLQSPRRVADPAKVDLSIVTDLSECRGSVQEM